jgi:aspartate kinase
MVTDEQHMRAMPIMEIVEEKLQQRVIPSVAQGRVVVTQGFIGITPGGRRTTMGRESSDFSAAIIGAGLNVSDVEIWTDVDGILTADPTVVEFPRKVKTLSFQEAFELSYFGAKVLHPNTMLPAIEKNIPIHIFNSRRPELSGSTVTSTSGGSAVVVKSIAYRKNLVLLTVTPAKRRGQFIFWEQIYSILTKYNVVAVMTATSEYALSIVLEGKHNSQAIVHELLEIGEVECTAGKASVCLVGENIRGSQFVMPRIFQALEGDYVHMISFGATTSSISLLIDNDDVLPAVKRLHREFFESREDSNLFEELRPASTLL